MNRVRSLTVRAAVVLALVTTAACGETPTAPSQFAPFRQTDLRLGLGAEAVTSSTVNLDYTLWLYNNAAADNKGLQVETSVGGTPFTFVLGSSQVIAGMNQGVAGMRVGGVRRLIIPPSLAYGQDRSGIIPPNATLVFEVDLLEVTAP